MTRPLWRTFAELAAADIQKAIADAGALVHLGRAIASLQRAVQLLESERPDQ